MNALLELFIYIVNVIKGDLPKPSGEKCPCGLAVEKCWCEEQI